MSARSRRRRRLLTKEPTHAHEKYGRPIPFEKIRERQRIWSPDRGAGTVQRKQQDHIVVRYDSQSSLMPDYMLDSFQLADMPGLCRELGKVSS